MSETRKSGTQQIISYAPFIKRSRFEILDHHVRVIEHAHQHGAASVSGEIKTNRALVAVYADEIGRIFVMEGRPPIACLVARGRLDLDDIGTVIGEYLRAIRPTEHSRQIDHPKSGQRAGGRF